MADLNDTRKPDTPLGAEELERQRTEEALQESEERFRLLVKGTRDHAIFILDPAGYILTWNKGAEQLKGYTAGEIIGQHFSRFYPPEDLARGKPTQELESALRDGQREDEGWRVRKNGSQFWANVVLTALHDQQGRLCGFIKLTRDMTERKQIGRASCRERV